MENHVFIKNSIVEWFSDNKRSLPWRQDRDPYHVWISEIMLQQTRVEAVVEYYNRFIKELPSVEFLAEADDDRLMKLWEGLGYYSRARNLKKAAIVITEKYGGIFPVTYPEILSLPGVGLYTAGAIASICYDQPTPAVDGNVLRVYSRLFCYPDSIDRQSVKNEISRDLEALYSDGDCAEITQGLMELGACVCLPNAVPKCGTCPVYSVCQAGQAGSWADYPVRAQKKPRKEVDRIIFLLCSNDRFAIRKRPAKGLLAGLWEFPGIEIDDPKKGCSLTQEEMIVLADRTAAKLCKLKNRNGRIAGTYTHIFTHVQWNMIAFIYQAAEQTDGFSWVSTQEMISDYALPSAFRPFIGMCHQ